MGMSKRILTKWRQDALKLISNTGKEGFSTPERQLEHAAIIMQANRILFLTQELLDQHLLKEK